MKRVAVLIPCYNEALTVKKVVSDFHKALPDASIYVYDNNSTDATAELAQEAGAIVRREPHQGKGNVVRTMFREVDADAYVLVDGDDTYPAEEVGKLLDPVLNGNADMVIGDRLSNGTYYQENKRPFHDFGNNLVRNLINHLFHGHIHDIMTGYRVFSRRFAKCMPVRSEGFQIETEMSIFALIMHLNIVEIPITYRDRPAGSFSKLNTYKDGWKVLVMLFDLYKNYRPFYFFFWVFVVLLLTGIIVMHASVSLGGLITGILLAVSAVTVMATGIILDSTKNQTLQILEEILNDYASQNHGSND